MKAVRLTDRGIATLDVDRPDGPGVRVRITSAGICGSDLHMLSMGPSPVTLGHEFGGFVEDGRLVAVRPYLPCGTCDQCVGNLIHLCSETRRGFHGATVDGGLAEEVLVAPDCIFDLPTGTPPGAAALVEPLAVAVHAVNRGHVVSGERTLVIGGGTIGLMCAAVLRDRGLAVDIATRHPAQRDAAEAVGAGQDSDEQYQLVIDAAGSPESMRRAIKSAEPGGRIVLVALPWDPIPISALAVLKEVTIVPALYYGLHDGVAEFDMAAALLRRNPWLFDAIVTHRFPLSRSADAFRVAADRAAGAIKVLFEPDV